MFTIVKNIERYGSLGDRFPESFQVEGLTLDQTILLAEQMSNHEAGCDFAYYCLEDPEMKF